MSVLLLAWAGLFISVLPGVLWLGGERRSIPIFEAICVSYGVQDVAPALLFPNNFRSVFALANFNEAELSSTLVIVVIGLVTMELTYCWVRYGAAGGMLPKLNLPLDDERLRWYLPAAILIGGTLVTAGIQGFTPSGESGLAAIVAVMVNQLAVAIAILTYRVLDGANQRSRASDALLLGLGITWAVVVGLATTMLESALTVPVIVAAIGLQRRRRSVWGLLLLVAAAYLFVLQPVKFSVRTMPADLSDTSAFSARINAWGTAASEQVTRLVQGAAIEDVYETTRQSLQRLDFVHVMVHVRSNTPDVIPFFGGYSYSYFVTGWIPRLVWPDKPTAQQENITLVLTYGLSIRQVLEHTSLAVGTLAEAYANFGDPGVMGFMLLQGIVLGSACRIFAGQGSIGGQAVLLSILVFFLNGINTNTTTLYGGVVQNLTANGLLLWLLVGARQRRIAPHQLWLSRAPTVSTSP
jgi:hypothetical protein